jgi:asparagine synthase (glutamine-hydrolysing)
MTSQGNRVVLSGIGGDEVTGGVPTPIPELEDLLASFRFRQLAHQLKVWAINKRKPWLHLFFETARGFAPSSIVGMPKHMRPAPWLNRNFVKRNRTALQGYETRFKLFGSPPSFQENISTFDGLRRQLTCDCPHSEPLYEKRYPYLDRELLEFLYAIPREQLVRPGQRRSLMRRALVGIVPDKLLSRKRKGFVVRGPIAAVSAEWASLVGISRHMICTSLGIVDEDRLSKVLNEARQGQEVLIVTLTRTLRIEAWLRNLNARGILASTELRRQQPMKALAPNAMSD